ncbi:ATP-binding cassette domain-containing protein [Lentilactobacillus hilgardii]|uniref:ATP-binding cassette domain-containing protein n=1 Tax=Lentilactobacillus hilgardii TaxID=1588 RepID=UPI00298CDA64|nr:ATP-binding cassette domain-containing protein [Lentilactobacillus hilgardii]
MAEIHDDICKLPDGYDTQLSEGAGLSGGQLQRIAIARSLVSQAKVLIFDESTSNLDLLTEKRIIQNLLKLKGKTLIFIAHRLEIARNVDSIVVMNKGKIVETGNHKELLNHKGEYFELCSK